MKSFHIETSDVSDFFFSCHDWECAIGIHHISHYSQPQVSSALLTSHRTVAGVAVGGFPRRSKGGLTGYGVNENHGAGGRGGPVPTVGDKAGDSWEICGLGFMSTRRPPGGVLI